MFSATVNIRISTPQIVYRRRRNASTLIQLKWLHPARGTFMTVYVLTRLEHASIKNQGLFFKAVFTNPRRSFNWT
jgi:hypothetical protein